MCYIYPDPLNTPPDPAVKPYYTHGATDYNKAYDATDAIIGGNLEAIRRFKKAYKQAAANRINPLKGLPTRTS